MKIIKGKKQYALIVNKDELTYITAAVGDSSDLRNQQTRKRNGFKNTELIEGYALFDALIDHVK